MDYWFTMHGFNQEIEKPVEDQEVELPNVENS